MESSEECVYLRREKYEATETTVLQKPLRYLSACRTLIDKSVLRGGFRYWAGEGVGYIYAALAIVYIVL